MQAGIGKLIAYSATLIRYVGESCRTVARW